jgi:hypothetical protein
MSVTLNLIGNLNIFKVTHFFIYANFCLALLFSVYAWSQSHPKKLVYTWKIQQYSM